MKKVICVTGGSSGFGYEVSKILALKGHTVYAGARNIEKMESLKDFGVHVLELNVTKESSVKAFVDHVIKTESHIDVLINNAGYGAYGVSETQSLSSIQNMYDVNVFGVIRMNQQVIPYMRERRQGRIIQIASLVSHVSIPGISHYAATKHALRSTTESLRSEIRPFGIDVVQIEPGAVNTGFEEVALGLIEPTHEDYHPFLSSFKTFIKKSYKKGPSPDSTVKAMVKASLIKKPKWVYRTTLDAKIYPIAKGFLGLKLYSYISSRLIFKAKKRTAQRT
jgi:short-subunit dehydrogenase